MRARRRSAAPGAAGATTGAASVVGLVRGGLSPSDAFVAAGWGDAGADGAPADAEPPFAVAARLAHATGAPLAPILEACAEAAREEGEAALTRDAALAGPLLSARVLAWLPAVGLGLAAIADGGVIRVLATPIGLALLGAGCALALAGRWWMRALVRRATTPHAATGLVLHAVRAAMLAGADVASALAAVANACDPEPTLAREAASLRRAALALAAGDEWSAAWGDTSLSALEGALRMPWERGAHAAPILAAVAANEALSRRRAAQVAASELSVRLTLPLAVCLLPAFVLVGIVPLVVSLVGGLR